VTTHRTGPAQPHGHLGTDDGTAPVVSRGREKVVIFRKWHTVDEVAEMLGYGLTKTKMLIITGELRSLKDGRSRRVLPEWVDEYVARRAAESQGLES
jgi:excisionase family DNA binding protein